MGPASNHRHRLHDKHRHRHRHGTKNRDAVCVPHKQACGPLVLLEHRGPYSIAIACRAPANASNEQREAADQPINSRPFRWLHATRDPQRYGCVGAKGGSMEGRRDQQKGGSDQTGAISHRLSNRPGRDTFDSVIAPPVPRGRCNPEARSPHLTPWSALGWANRVPGWGWGRRGQQAHTSVAHAWVAPTGLPLVGPT